MRFDSEIYEKVFPRTEPPKPVESAIETFKPTEEKQKAMDEQPGENPAQPEEIPEPAPVIEPEENKEKEEDE